MPPAAAISSGEAITRRRFWRGKEAEETAERLSSALHWQLPRNGSCQLRTVWSWQSGAGSSGSRLAAASCQLQVLQFDAQCYLLKGFPGCPVFTHVCPITPGQRCLRDLKGLLLNNIDCRKFGFNVGALAADSLQLAVWQLQTVSCQLPTPHRHLTALHWQLPRNGSCQLRLTVWSWLSRLAAASCQLQVGSW